MKILPEFFSFQFWIICVAVMETTFSLMVFLVSFALFRKCIREPEVMYSVMKINCTRLNMVGVVGGGGGGEERSST